MEQISNCGATSITQSEWHFLSAWHGGTVHSLALSPNFTEDGTVLAATAVGLFHSFDSGTCWTRIGDGLADPSILALAFASAQVAFASSAQGRLYRSGDSGYSWQPLDAWSGLGVITAIVISPNYTQDHSLFVATSEGIFRSLNDGVEWQEASFGLLDLDVLCLAYTPNFAENETLWAGTAFGGLFRSRNNGRAWREMGAGLPDCAIQTLALSPNYQHDQTLFVGTESDGVYLSRDGGATWQPSGRELAGTSVNALTCGILDADLTGEHGSKDPNQRSSAFISVQKIVTLAATGAGLFRSLDGGESWQACDGDPMLALDVKLAANGIGLAGDYRNGIVRSADGGKSWQVSAAAFSAHAPPLIAATTQGDLYALDETGALAYLANGQTTWQALNLPPTNEAVAALAVGTKAGTEMLYVTDAQTLYAYQPQAQEWSALDVAGEAFHLLQTGPGESLLLADQTGHIYLSLDGGASWQRRTMPWVSSTDNSAGETLLQVHFSPFFADDQTLVAVSVRGNPAGHFALAVWRSNDGGQQWQALADLESAVPSVVSAFPADGSTQPFFLATQHRLVKFFTGATGELTVEQTFFAEDDSITALAASPDYASDHTIHLATRKTLYRSIDGGITWQPVGSGYDRPVVALIAQAGRGGLTAILLGGEACVFG